MKRLLAIIIVLAGTALTTAAQQGEQLKYAIVVTRHGVRSPTWTPDRLNEYSSAPWPDWKTAPGNLTSHGRTLMEIMGGFYREYFAKQGLNIRKDCTNPSPVYFWADTDQRTVETARALAETIRPECKTEVGFLSGGKGDPLFDPLETGSVKMDSKLGLASVQGRIGPDLQTLVETHRAAFDVLNSLLNGDRKAPKSIFDQPISLTADESGASMNGPLNLASTLTEDFLLEYTDGKSGNDLGWGRLNASKLQQIMSLHTAYADLMRRTPYLSQARGSILMNRILRSLEQAASGKAVAGALGGPETVLAIVSGHDTNLSNLSGLLNLSWTLPSHQTDDVPPGGALIFSLWQSNQSRAYSVRLQFVAQTLDQMHDATPLSLAHPPAISNVFVPGCSTAPEGFPCSWYGFQKVVANAIDPAFIPSR